LVGFACVGAEARVPGEVALADVVDVGFGMRPDLVGHGLGNEFVATILLHVEATEAAGPGAELRVVVQAWNLRSRRVVERAGFIESHRLTVDQHGAAVEYVELRRPG